METQGSSRAVHEPDRGQSLVEFALVLPLILFMALAIFDFGRVLTTAITLEAAAREAADFGALYPWYWDEDRPDNIAATEAGMELRACSAASTLTDYEADPPSSTATCSNPSFSYELIKPSGVTNCYAVAPEDQPCRVRVTLDYTFHIIVPLSLKFGDATLGLPDTVEMSRSSLFAISDFQVDVEPSAAP